MLKNNLAPIEASSPSTGGQSDSVGQGTGVSTEAERRYRISSGSFAKFLPSTMQGLFGQISSGLQNNEPSQVTSLKPDVCSSNENKTSGEASN